MIFSRLKIFVKSASKNWNFPIFNYSIYSLFPVREKERICRVVAVAKLISFKLKSIGLRVSKKLTPHIPPDKESLVKN